MFERTLSIAGTHAGGVASLLAKDIVRTPDVRAVEVCARHRQGDMGELLGAL